MIYQKCVAKYRHKKLINKIIINLLTNHLKHKSHDYK